MKQTNNSELHNDWKNQIEIELIKLINQKNISALRNFVQEYPMADIAAGTEVLNPSEQLYLLRILKTSDAAELFSYLAEDIQYNLVYSLTEQTESCGINVLKELQTDELADVLEDLPANLTRKILNATDKEKREKVNSILAYEDSQVGSIMSVDISTVINTWTCKMALLKIKSDYRNKLELTHNIYVTDKNGLLIGNTTLEEIVFSDDEDIIENISSPVRAIYTSDSKELASLIFAEQDRSTLPVINHDNFLIGMITSDDVIDVIQEAATEDIYKMSGINPELVEENYLKTSVKSIVKSRIFWLLVLMLSATLSQFVIQQFTDISETFINNTLTISIPTAIIVGLIPVISGSAGNAGSQSSTTITRAAALGEIARKDISRAIWKEIKVAAIVGLFMFLFNIIRLYIYFAIFRDYHVSWAGYTFVIVGSSISLFLVVVFAKFLGTIIPIIAIRLKKDPAVMSAPILTTLSDALSTLIFFAINIGMLYLGVKLGSIPTTELSNGAEIGNYLKEVISEINF
ncbi:magnesium transporter [Mycoplasmopsis cricetuli]|uniref:magnesium transporter n=1 Tax=Mycoplasmopsis cricetuli TaxID=171283 RepID=UPI000470E3CF|nr:magnesium transporter [Mycoplasmopsis cricetuli]